LRKFIVLVFYTLAVTQAFADTISDTTARPVPNTLGSRFFFPNSIGLSVPFRSTNTSLRHGFAINAGVEYRPKYMNAVFYTIDLALLNNNYTSYVHNLPTNIIQGKLSSDFILTGAGYRKKLNRWAIYGEALPGLGMRSYDRATINTGGVLISRVTNDSFAAKGCLGLEYYIKQHFDAFFEPSYYKFFNRQGFNSSRSQLLGFNVGIATARF
jgi:hypothetical protein